MNQYKEYKKHIFNDKNIVDYSENQLRYLQKPVGNAAFNTEVEPIKSNKKKNWFDRIKCDVCGKEFTRSARTKHNSTQYHQIYSCLNTKLIKIIVDNNIQ